MKDAPTISYILCTKNKLRYLQCTVPDLLKGVREQDEIIVFDGESTDGSREYLEAIYRDGKFRIFRSEPDRNQAHALNKANLCARGQIIKVVLDDDVLDYRAMQKCADFLIANPSIDVLGANVGIGRYDENCEVFADLTKQRNFERWLARTGDPFWFQDQCFMFRRASLPIVGFWHVGVNCIDVEMTLRLASLRQVRIAWYTATAAVHLLNEGSLGIQPDYASRIPDDIRRIYRFYGVECPPEWRPLSLWARLRTAVRLRTRLRNAVTKRTPAGTKTPMPYEEAYATCKRWLQANSGDERASFLS